MGQFSKVLLAIDKVHTAPQKALDCGSGLCGLNQVYGPTCPTPPVQSIYGKYINIFTRCTNRNQHDILMTVVANVSKGKQTCHTQVRFSENADLVPTLYRNKLY